MQVRSCPEYQYKHLHFPRYFYCRVHSRPGNPGKPGNVLEVFFGPGKNPGIFQK